MSAEGVAELDAFLAVHGNKTDQKSNLFGWWPRDIDITTEEPARPRRTWILIGVGGKSVILMTRDIALEVWRQPSHPKHLT